MADSGPGGAGVAWLRPVPLTAFLTPLIAAPSGRGLVPVLIIVGGWSLLEAVRRKRLPATFLRPLSLWALFAAGVAIASTAWGRAPADALRVGTSFLGLAVAGLALLAAADNADSDERHAVRLMLAAGLALAVALLGLGTVYAYLQDLPLWGKPDQHPLRTLSHAQTVLAVVAVPGALVLWRMGGRARLFAAALAGLLVVAFAFLEHGASNLAVIAAAVVGAAILIGGSRWALVTGVLLGAAVIAVPAVLNAVLPPLAELEAAAATDGPWPSELHRQLMWRFALDRINEAGLWLGFGADASRGFPGAARPVMWGIELMPLHPHNGAVQMWLELGVVGVLLAAVPALLSGLWLRRRTAADAAVGAAVLVAFAVPWFISYGVWQSWWLALGWLAAAIARGLMSE